MNAVSKHQNSKDERGNHFEIRNLSKIYETAKLFVAAKEDHATKHQKKEPSGFQEKFVQCSKEVFKGSS